MKIRSGYVSNSSSSSFIVATDGDPIVTVRIDLTKFISKTLTTKEEILEWYLDDYGYTEEELLGDRYHKPKYEAMLKAIENGKKIYQGSASNESYEGDELFIYGGGLRSAEGVEIIDSCEH